MKDGAEGLIGDVMSKPRYKWWGYVKGIIREYPELQKKYDALHSTSITANMSGMPGGGGISRAVENTALKELQRTKQAELDAVKKAIAATQLLKTSKERLDLVRLVFWKQSHTLAGAAMATNVSYETAVNYHRDFIILTAYFRDLIELEDLSEHQINYIKKP